MCWGGDRIHERSCPISTLVNTNRRIIRLRAREDGERVKLVLRQPWQHQVDVSRVLLAEAWRILKRDYARRFAQTLEVCRFSQMRLEEDFHHFVSGIDE